MAKFDLVTPGELEAVAASVDLLDKNVALAIQLIRDRLDSLERDQPSPSPDPAPPDPLPPEPEPQLPAQRWMRAARDPVEVRVRDDREFGEAIADAKPGHQIVGARDVTVNGFNFPKGLKGTADNPIGIWAEVPGRFTIRSKGGNNVYGQSVSHIIFDGVNFIGAGAETANDDAAGIKMTHANTYGADEWVSNILIRNCLINGSGTDGIKLAAARHCAIVGCIIETGDIYETGIDVVTGHSVLVAYNTILAGRQDGLTFKVGSQDNVVHHNYIHSQGHTGAFIGGHGSSYKDREYPDELLGFHCRRTVYSKNYLRSNDKALVLAGARDSVVSENFLHGSLKETSGGAWRDRWSSQNNVIENNHLLRSAWYQVSDGQGSGSRRTGNQVADPTTVLQHVGASYMPAEYREWGTSGSHLPGLIGWR